jgi:hypothetical protein
MNVRQYNQAAPTPFASPPLAQYLGRIAESQGPTALLNGSLSRY